MTIAPEPVLDPALAYPPVGAAQAGLRAADWPAVQAAFSGASSAYERHLIVTAAGALESSEDFLEAVVQRDRSDVLAATLLAAREVRIGWTLRGSGRGETVDAGMARGFRGHLARAEQLLIEACARDPRGDDVGVVAAADGGEGGRPLNPGLHEDLAVEPDPDVRLTPETLGETLERGRVLVDHGDRMTGRIEGRCQGRAHAATAHNHDMHGHRVPHGGTVRVRPSPRAYDDPP